MFYFVQAVANLKVTHLDNDVFYCAPTYEGRNTLAIINAAAAAKWNGRGITRSTSGCHAKQKRGNRASPSQLIDTLEGRHGLALVFVKGRVNDTTVLEDNVGRLGIGLEGQSVLHPGLIITLGWSLATVK